MGNIHDEHGKPCSPGYPKNIHIQFSRIGIRQHFPGEVLKTVKNNPHNWWS